MQIRHRQHRRPRTVATGWREKGREKGKGAIPKDRIPKERIPKEWIPKERISKAKRIPKQKTAKEIPKEERQWGK